ncbi:MAG: hypothetical protein WCS94_05635 [Verrucomicrobiota bacterium]
MKTSLACFAILLSAAVLPAIAGNDHFVQKINLTSDLTAVIAEGDWEAPVIRCGYTRPRMANRVTTRHFLLPVSSLNAMAA